MSLTNITTVSEQVQKFWGALFMKELRESALLPSLVNKDYQGDLKQFGDTVYVSQINAPLGALRTVGTDSDSYVAESMSTSRVAVQANKRAVAAFKIEDTAQIMSQLGQQDSEIRNALMYSCMKQMNDYLYSLVNPSTSSPDHVLNSITDMNASQLSAIRLLAAQAKWANDGRWYALVDPSYYSDVLNAQTLTSSDYVSDQALVGGQVVNKRFGFNILEDNSLGTDKGLFFHPDFMHMVMAKEPTFKVSDLHPTGQFGYVISCDIVFGAALGISGANKHISAVAAASGLANS